MGLYICSDLTKIIYDDFYYQGQIKIEAELKSKLQILLSEGAWHKGSLNYRGRKSGWASRELRSGTSAVRNANKIICHDKLMLIWILLVCTLVWIYSINFSLVYSYRRARSMKFIYLVLCLGIFKVHHNKIMYYWGFTRFFPPLKRCMNYWGLRNIGLYRLGHLWYIRHILHKRTEKQTERPKQAIVCWVPPPCTPILQLHDSYISIWRQPVLSFLQQKPFLI